MVVCVGHDPGAVLAGAGGGHQGVSDASAAVCIYRADDDLLCSVYCRLTKYVFTQPQAVVVLFNQRALIKTILFPFSFTQHYRRDNGWRE